MYCFKEITQSIQSVFHGCKSYLVRLTSIGFAVIYSLFILACSDPTPTQLDTRQGVSLVLPSTLIDTLQIDSIYFEIDGVEFQSWSLDHFQSEIELPILSPGASQILKVEVYESGVLRYLGQEVFDVSEEEPLSVVMQLLPQFRYLKFQVPLGLDNPLGIEGGELSLGELKDSLNPLGFVPYFEVGPVNLGETYQLQVVLWDSMGDTLFQYEDSLVVSHEDESVGEWIFETVGVAGSLILVLEEEDELSGGFLFKASQKRRARTWKDLVISELMVQPTSSGSQLEYIEVVNTQVDSLVLDSCQLMKSRGSSSLSSLVELGSIELPPQSGLILGGAEVDSDVELGSFTLTNTRMALLIMCEGELVDSIYYETSADSLDFIELQQGYSWELQWDQWSQGENMSAWCSSNSSWSIGDSINLFGSPGTFDHCS